MSENAAKLTDAIDNLRGVESDMKNDWPDPVCLETLSRVIGQLAEVHASLPQADQGDARDADLGRTHMVVCPHCGNKRCPHAENRAFLCTHSNAVGQVGVLADVGPIDATMSPAPTEDAAP